MTYAGFGIIALCVQFIINYDVIFKKTSDKLASATAPYRRFLLGLTFYYITDIAWGLLDDFHAITALYIDTVLYFTAMALSLLLWTHYVISYLGAKSRFGKGLYYSGYAFCVYMAVILTVNFFSPIVFSYDSEGNYTTGFMRYALLTIQIVIFLLTSVHTISQSRSTSPEKKIRFITIGVFGIVMITLIVVQVYFPLVPLYGIGCMLGNCLLHTFVLEDEKAEYRRTLEEMLDRENEQKRQLGSARHLAYTDPLTGVKSRHAYLEATDSLDRGIAEGTSPEFGVIVCDINGLKIINDTFGHEEGDKYICEGCMMVCRQFTHSPVYRIGGDEFAVLLEGSDYEHRDELLSGLETQAERNIGDGKVVISTGMSVFRPSDSSYSAVFERADRKMYTRKDHLKGLMKK